MYVLIIKAFIVHFMCFSCNALKLFEREAEFLERVDVGTKNDSSFWKTLVQEQPIAILLELQASLLEKLKGILEDENDSDGTVSPTTLATFDSMGLQEVSMYNDTFELRQAILALQPAVQQRQAFSPAIRAMTELLHRGLPQGSVLLVTASKPSDENFMESLMRSLKENKSRVNAPYSQDSQLELKRRKNELRGNEMSDDYLFLKEASDRTGGKFRYLQNDSENLSRPSGDNFSGSIKFPEDQTQSSGEQTPLVSRAADQRVFQKMLVPLIVEVASGTSLEIRPGTPTQIQFDVKNNINLAVQVHFDARYNSISQSVQPVQTVIPPSGTITVTVNVFTGLAQNLNAVGTVTLFARTGNRVIARSALISTTPQTITDNTPPKMHYKYEGDCSNYREPQNCENGHWGLEVTFHDEDSGILKILSEPYGLLFQNEFVAGTKTPVTVYYSATCCRPNAHIWAEDLRGNYVKKSFDVFNQNLLAGEIASIVLGVLLLLCIILAIIAAVVLIKRRNQRNLIIPRARSGSR